MDYPYWQKQDPAKPLFPDIEWSRPEQRALSGRLGIVGGNKLGFAGVAESYTASLSAGAGHVRVLLPDTLKKTIPSTMTDVIFGPSNPSGSLSKNALPEVLTLTQWSTGILLAGDAGRNSETAILYEEFLRNYTGPLTLTRDAIDLVKNDGQLLASRSNTLLVLSFAQLQKLLQSVYYPKILTFSMQLLQFVETVHKFTITYPLAIAVLHRDTLIVAYNGRVTTTQWESPMAIWRGVTAARAATYWLWSPSKVLESVTASLIDTQQR